MLPPENIMIDPDFHPISNRVKLNGQACHALFPGIGR
jgi:hypothetical protein